MGAGWETPPLFVLQWYLFDGAALKRALFYLVSYGVQEEERQRQAQVSEISRRLDTVLNNLWLEPCLEMRRTGPMSVQVRMTERLLNVQAQSKGRTAALLALNELQRRINLEFEKEFRRLAEL